MDKPSTGPGLQDLMSETAAQVSQDFRSPRVCIIWTPCDRILTNIILLFIDVTCRITPWHGQSLEKLLRLGVEKILADHYERVG